MTLQASPPVVEVTTGAAESDRLDAKADKIASDPSEEVEALVQRGRRLRAVHDEADEEKAI